MPAPQSLLRRALVALLLTAGFYVLTLALAAALFYAAHHALVTRASNPLLILSLFALSVALPYSLVPKPDDFEPPGPRLRPEDHPRFFAVLDELARATGQPVPHEVYLVPAANASVASRGGIMGLGSRRVMQVGLPLLQLLEVDQLRAVLAHELGHYHGGDVWLAPFIYRTRASIARTIEVTRGSIAQLPFELYGSMFLRITSEIARHQELQADALAARIVGPQPLVHALKTLSAASLAHAAFLRFDLVPVLQAGYRPPLIEGFRQFLSVEEHARAMQAVTAAELEHDATHAYDSHPALADRIAAIEGLASGPPAFSPRSGLAIALLDAPERLEAELLEHLLPAEGREREPVSWAEVGTRVLPEILRQRSERLAELVDRLTPGTIPTDREGLALWAQRTMRGDEDLARGEAPHEVQAAVAADALGTLILHRLVETGWQLEVAPGRAIAAARDGRRFEVVALLQGLAAGSISAWTWRMECEAHGVLDLPLRGRLAGEDDHRPSEARAEPALPSTWTPIAWEQSKDAPQASRIVEWP